ncbi:MAG: hypothetical protein WBM44_26535, partial [Waterburya sp.]
MLCKFLFWLGLIGSLGLFSSAQALIPLTDAQGQFIADEQGDFLPDLSFSLADLSPLPTGGSFVADSEITRLAGYDSSRIWQAGDHPIDVIQFADFQGFGLETLTLNKINGSVAADYSLAELGLLDDMTLRELADTVPGLKSQKAGSIAPLKAVLPSQLWHVSVQQLLDQDTTDLKQSLRLDRSKNIAQDLKSQLLVNQDLTITGITEGIEVSVEDIASQLQELAPLLELNPKFIQKQISNHVSEEVKKAQLELQRKIEYYVDSYFYLPSANIEGVIDKSISDYQAEVAQIVVNSKHQVIQSIYSQLETQLNLEQIAVIEGSLDQLNLAVDEFLVESGKNLTRELTTVVTDEFLAVDGIVGQLPRELGDLSLESLNFDNYYVGDIPGLDQTAINKFPNYKNQTLSSVPGLENLPLSKYPDLPVFGGGIARIDWVFSDIERYADRAISGSQKEGFIKTFCYESNSENGGCAHVELVGNINNGKHWISG